MAISKDGNIMAIGTNGNNYDHRGHAHVYQFSSKSDDWKQMRSNIGGEEAGSGSA